MSEYKLAPAIVTGDVNDIRVTYDGMHNAWAVFQDGEPKYVFEFDDTAEEMDQKRNAERTMEWCMAKERQHGAR